MKRVYTIFILLVAFLQLSMAQEVFYVYKHNGEVNQYIISHVTSIAQSKIGVDGIEYNDYVTQEITTDDSISRIQLSMVDSISFSTPDPIKSISDAYVSIDWTNTDLLLFDPINGRYSIYCKGEIPNIKQESVIIIETDTASCVVLVTEVSKLDRKFDVKGELGDISYLFFDTEFTLTTEKNSTTTSPNHKNFRSARRSIEVEDDGTIRATGTLWKTPSEEQTNIFYKRGDTQAYTKSKFGMNIDYEVKLRFGDKEAIEKDGMRFYYAKNLYVDANLKGTMDAYYDFYLDVNHDEDNIDLAPEKIDKYGILKHKLFPTIPLKFTIGMVPVTIDLGADLFADVSLKAGGALQFTTGIGASANTLIGVRYDEKKLDNLEFYYKEKPSLVISPHNPTVSGKGKVSGKVHIFPRIHAWIYGVSGPSIDIKPYLRTELSGGFKKDILQNASSDYYAWSLNTYCGLDLAAGLSISNWNYEVWNRSTKDLKVLEYNLYNSPVDIQLRSASPDKISKGETTLVSFEVFDKGFDGKNVLTPLPQIVKFEGKGEINSTAGQFGVAESGCVTASWIPSSSTDILYAKLYDIDGNIIAESQYSKEIVIPVSISSVTTTAAQYRPTDHPQHFIYKDTPFEFKYDVATTVKLTDEEGVENWGYVYEGPYEGDKKSRISLKGATPEYEDTRFPYYRNGSPTKHTVRLYPFVKYTGDDEYYYGEPVDYPLTYPETSTVELTGCSTNDVVTRENVEYNGVKYDYCSTFILDYNATGAYWITVGAEEIGNGWSGWDNSLPARERARATDGSNRLTINYYYNQKVLEGDYKLRIKGTDEQHGTSCTSPQSVKLTHNGKTFTGCEIIQ